MKCKKESRLAEKDPNASTKTPIITRRIKMEGEQPTMELDIILEDHTHSFRPRQRTLRDRLHHTMSHCFDG